MALFDLKRVLLAGGLRRNKQKELYDIAAGSDDNVKEINLKTCNNCKRL
jgi:hypothetical protein